MSKENLESPLLPFEKGEANDGSGIDFSGIKLNEFQSALTEDLLKPLNEKYREVLYDFLVNVPLVQWLISPERPRAKDLPRDEKGRIIVDIAHPHILEDMDYFRPSAIFFEQNGCYTKLLPNANPHSPYRRFWEEEKRRCWEGYVRESDGEWVTGFMYWYLNYSPIMINILQEKNSKKLSRIETFPYTWEGIYLRFHYLYQARENGHHAIELAKRSCSKSYTLASMASHNLILGEDSVSNKRVQTVFTAYLEEYLASKDGTLSKFEPMINFSFTNTPFPHLLSVNTPNKMIWKMGYVDKATKQKKGSENTVMGVTSKDNSSKLRGKRGWIFFEEMGSMPNLIDTYNTTRRNAEEGSRTFSTIFLVGTSSEKDSDFAAAKKMLYATDGYNLQSVENVYDKKGHGKSMFGYFFPAYLNRIGCYNHDGVSDVTMALVEILEARQKSELTNDADTIMSVVREDPVTPEEAMIRVRDAFFPVAALNERAAQLDQSPSSYDDVYVGNLVQKADGSVHFVPSNDQPIHKYPVDNTTRGALELFAMPQKDNSGKVFRNRYILGFDPIDNDSGDSKSLASVFVFDLFTDKIVAEYTGRMPFAEENYEMVRLLCLYYNGQCLYESNIKGCYMYFSKMNGTHLLADTPEHLREKGLVKYNNFGSNQKGVRAGAAINNYANQLIRDWLNKPVNIIMEKDGKDMEYTVKNLNLLKNRALIDELVQFNPYSGNYDRIRSLGLVMLLREERLVTLNGNIERLSQPSKDDIAYDKFFNDNYHQALEVGSRMYEVGSNEFGKSLKK